KLDANDSFLNAKNIVRPELRYGQFGGTLTGPIWKNHVFFTASYQGDRYLTNAAPTDIQTESAQWRAVVASAFPGSAANKIYSSFPASAVASQSDSTTLSDYVAASPGGSGFSTFAMYMCPDNYPNGFQQLATQYQ